MSGRTTAQIVADLRKVCITIGECAAHRREAADRLEALEAELDRCQLADIASRNPGIDIEAVKAERAKHPRRWIGSAE
jgi:hypothetical protein